MDSTVVIKVKYGDTLRRFTANVDKIGVLDFDMCELKEKIRSLFAFSPDADPTLTYIDEDNDLVTILDDDDLREATLQNLNPLRIIVPLNCTTVKRAKFRLNRSSPPKGSPRVKHPSSRVESGVADEVLKFIKEPMLDAFSKVSHELTAKVTSLVLTKLVECLTNLQVFPVLDCQDAERSTEKLASECPMGPNVNEDPEFFKDMAKPKASLNAKVVEPIPERLEKELDNVDSFVGTSVPQNTSPVDLIVDLPKDSYASGFLNESNLNIPSPVSQPDMLSDDNENKAQKHDGVHPSWSSIASGCPANALHPIQASETPVPLNRGFCFLNGDNIKIVPGEQSSASQAAFSPHDISSVSCKTGVDSHSSMPPWYDCVYPFKDGNGYTDSGGRVFHKGIRCDGCGVFPIMGPRFKSKVNEDYDLCSICFPILGNEAEYTRLNRPVSCWSPWLTKNTCDPHPRKPLVLPHSLQHCKAKPRRQNFDSRSVQDVVVVDDSVMAPNIPFTKIWKMRNVGSTSWPYGTKLVWIGGDQFTDQFSVEIKKIPVDGFPVDKELDIAVDFTAPKQHGRYISYWKMSLPSGEKFGQRISVFIQVDTSVKGPADTSPGFNLNYPPETCWAEGKKITDLDVDCVDGILPQPGQFKKAAEESKIKAMVDKWQSIHEKLDYPVVDGLITRNEVSVAVSDLDFDLPVASSRRSPFSTDMFSREVTDSNDVEQTFLMKLEQMGFKKTDLNREILRMNKYNLEKSVDDLCGVAEWDPILEELQEMGFCDEEKNKKLVMKNRGSIKQVVMGLIAREKA